MHCFPRHARKKWMSAGDDRIVTSEPLARVDGEPFPADWSGSNSTLSAGFRISTEPGRGFQRWGTWVRVTLLTVQCGVRKR